MRKIIVATKYEVFFGTKENYTLVRVFTNSKTEAGRTTLNLQEPFLVRKACSDPFEGSNVIEDF